MVTFERLRRFLSNQKERPAIAQGGGGEVLTLHLNTVNPRLCAAALIDLNFTEIIRARRLFLKTSASQNITY